LAHQDLLVRWVLRVPQGRLGRQEKSEALVHRERRAVRDPLGRLGRREKSEALVRRDLLVRLVK
jgi:hypothetical protein